jgi:hypothetical protein
LARAFKEAAFIGIVKHIIYSEKCLFLSGGSFNEGDQAFAVDVSHHKIVLGFKFFFNTETFSFTELKLRIKEPVEVLRVKFIVPLIHLILLLIIAIVVL